MKPIRIQLSRKRGWRMPPNTVKVDRSTRWGNPFTRDCYPLLLQDDGRWRGHALEDFRLALVSGRIERFTADDVLLNLRGKNLACWCKPGDACHADVLLEIANR